MALLLVIPTGTAAVDVNIDASIADTANPTVAISSPINGSSFTTASPPTSFTGTAADDSLGLGLSANSTTFSLKRTSDGKYWNGISWVSGETFLLTTHGATTTNDVANWTSAATLPTFTADTYTIKAVASDKSSNSGQATSSFTITEVAAPAAIPAPVITSPSDGATTADTTPTVSGTGTPGLTLDLTITDTGDTYSTTVNPDGTWSIDLTTPLTAGSYTASATQTDGVTTSPADTVDFTIGLAAPVITSPGDGDVVTDSTPTISGTGIAGATVTVTVVETGASYTTTVNSDGTWSVDVGTPLTDGNYTVSVTQSLGGLTSPADSIEITIGVPAPVITSPTEGQSVLDTTPVISGTGIAGATIEVTIAETGATYTTTVNSDGTWSVEITDQLPDGEYTATATQTIDGITSNSDSVTFFVGVGPPVITSPTQGSQVNDLTPTVTGTGIPGAVITLTVVETGEVYTTTVDPSGNWSLTLSNLLAPGDYSLSVTQTVNGVTSSPATVSFTVAPVNFFTGLLVGIPSSNNVNSTLAGLLAAGALIISALPALLQLPAALPVSFPIFNLFALFMGWLERRRRYGIVYDSTNREGVPNATVRLFAEGGNEFELGKLVESRKTDDKGRYTFNVEKGTYRLEVIQPEYIFPSNRASIGYRGETVSTDEGLLHPDIPIDNLSPAAHRKLVSWRLVGHRIQQLRLPIMIVGTILAIAYLVERTATVDIVIAILYAILWTFEVIGYIRSRNVAYVYTDRGPAPLVILRLHDAQGRLKTTRVTNLQGQYSIFAAAGRYLLDALKVKYDVSSSEVDMSDPGIIPKRIKLRRLNGSEDPRTSTP